MKLNVFDAKKQETTDFKKCIIFILISILLLILNLMISTTSYISWNLSLQLPFRSLYGNISWGITIIFGVLGIIFTKIFFNKQISIEKLFLIIAIPIGLLYCCSNPLGKVPDEDFHARKVMAIAHRTHFFCC